MNAPHEIYRVVYRHARSAGRLDPRTRTLLKVLAAELGLDEATLRSLEEAAEAERRASFALPGGPLDLTALRLSEPERFEVGQALSAVALDPGLTRVAAASLDGRLYLFELASGELLATLEGHDGDVNAVTWLDEGALLSAGDEGAVICWELRETRPRWTSPVHRAEASCVAASEAGDLVVSGGWDRRVCLLDPDGGALRQSFTARDRVNAVAVSSDGALVAAGTFEGVHLWQHDTGGERPWVERPGREVLALTFRPDRPQLAAGDDRGGLVLIDLESGRVVRTLEGHGEAVTSVAFAAQGRLLVSGGEDDRVRLWDVEEGRLLAHFAGDTGSVRGVAASADGRLVVSVGDGGDGPWGGREGVRLVRLA